MINLNLQAITDIPTRDALRRIQDELNANPLTQMGLRLYEIELDSAVTEHRLAHNLGYVPTDIIVAKSSGSDFSFDWELFTKESIYITTSGAVSIRCLIGRSDRGVVLT